MKCVSIYWFLVNFLLSSKPIYLHPSTSKSKPWFNRDTIKKPSKHPPKHPIFQNSPSLLSSKPVLLWRISGMAKHFTRKSSRRALFLTLTLLLHSSICMWNVGHFALQSNCLKMCLIVKFWFKMSRFGILWSMASWKMDILRRVWFSSVECRCRMSSLMGTLCVFFLECVMAFRIFHMGGKFMVMS